MFGGTFDPPHRGHFAAALAAADHAGLDEVRFLVANDPWQKTGLAGPAPATVRQEMARALLEDLATGDHRGRFDVDDREIRRGGVTYTVDTLEELHEQSPGVSLHLIVGQDTASRIVSTWREPRRIFELARIVVVSRDSGVLRTNDLPSDSMYVEMSPVDLSSSAVRELVRQGRDVSRETSPGVQRIIEAHGLYREPR